MNAFEDLRKALRPSEVSLIDAPLIFPPPPIVEPPAPVIVAATEVPVEALRWYRAPMTHTEVCVLHGPAGTGKTHQIREYEKAHPEQNILLTATTGVAAINIGPGCVTLNSAFKYFNEESLREGIDRRRSHIVNEIKSYDVIVIDEISMLPGPVLDMVYGLVESLNRENERKIRLLLSGDFCQLPPVAPKLGNNKSGPTPFAFKTDTWARVFERAVTRLTVNYRQDSDAAFQHALQMCRGGNAAACVASLACEYAPSVDMDFQGLTLYPVNEDVATHNGIKLDEINSPVIVGEARLWGDANSDWKDLLTPIKVKLGAQVRITANDTPRFRYVNGDIGTLLEYVPDQYARVSLHRPSEEGVEGLMVDPVARFNYRPLGRGETPPETCSGMTVPSRWTGNYRFAYEAYMSHCEAKRVSFYDPKVRKWVIGGIRYLPITLGWASTFHKAQGLTAPLLQVDIKNQFASNPQMIYVALSRCRTAKNIRITRGDPAKLAQRIRFHPDVYRFV